LSQLKIGVQNYMLVRFKITHVELAPNKIIHLSSTIYNINSKKQMNDYRWLRIFWWWV